MSQPVPPVPVADIARIGPFFAFTTGPAAATAGWRTARALAGDKDGLGLMIDDVAARLGTAHRWIAASIFYQGWAARLTSIYAGSASLCGAVPDLDGDLVSYRMPPSGPVEMSVAPLRALAPGDGWRSLREEHLDPLAAAIRRQVRIGGYLLAGNVGSALAGALGTIATQRRHSVGSLLSFNWTHPADVATSGRWLRTPDGPRYARTTCCGYEQLDRRGRCGDCSLNWHGARWPVIATGQDAPLA
jgi:hypothetical protein